MKVMAIKNKSDPYYRFIRMIEQHQTNPFFPKIYGIKLYESSDYFEKGDRGYGDFLVMYIFMEKLIPLHYLPEPQARQLLKEVGIDYPSPYKFKDDFSLRDLLDRPGYRQHIRTMTDYKLFRQALRLLEPMIRRFGSDLHIENIMIRETEQGYQLVIIDPLMPRFGYYNYTRHNI